MLLSKRILSKTTFSATKNKFISEHSSTKFDTSVNPTAPPVDLAPLNKSSLDGIIDKNFQLIDVDRLIMNYGEMVVEGVKFEKSRDENLGTSITTYDYLKQGGGNLISALLQSNQLTPTRARYFLDHWFINIKPLEAQYVAMESLLFDLNFRKQPNMPDQRNLSKTTDLELSSFKQNIKKHQMPFDEQLEAILSSLVGLAINDSDVFDYKFCVRLLEFLSLKVYLVSESLDTNSSSSDHLKIFIDYLLKKITSNSTINNLTLKEICQFSASLRKLNQSFEKGDFVNFKIYVKSCEILLENKLEQIILDSILLDSGSGSESKSGLDFGFEELFLEEIGFSGILEMIGLLVNDSDHDNHNLTLSLTKQEILKFLFKNIKTIFNQNLQNLETNLLEENLVHYDHDESLHAEIDIILEKMNLKSSILTRVESDILLKYIDLLEENGYELDIFRELREICEGTI